MNRKIFKLISGVMLSGLLVVNMFVTFPKAETVTTVTMTYDEKTYTKQIYDADAQQIAEGITTEGLKSIGEQVENLNFVSNGSISVDKNAVMDVARQAIKAGQTNIVINLKDYTKDAVAAQKSAALAQAGLPATDKASVAAPATPIISNAALNAAGIDCKISDAVTKFNAGQDRAVNIRNAASKINGMILQPGQAFSADLFFTPRTVANGYGLGNVISGGTYVKAIGGGICQVSSTLNLAVLRAGIIPVERHNHSHRSGYIGSGLDATISSGSLDYTFVNTLSYPICIMTSADGGVLNVAIYSNHAALNGASFEPVVEGGALQNKTYLVGKINGVPVSKVYCYSSKYKE